jgi:hypothetical protein
VVPSDPVKDKFGGIEGLPTMLLMIVRESFATK